MSSSPVWGQADAARADGDTIALAGFIQPHGLVMVLHEPLMRIVQISANAGAMLHRPVPALLLATLRDLDVDFHHQLKSLLSASLDGEPQSLRCRLGMGPAAPHFEGVVHRTGPDMLVLALEPLRPEPGAPYRVDLPGPVLQQRLAGAVQRLIAATSLPDLAQTMVGCLRELLGHDRVVACKLDSATGQTTVVAESGNARLTPMKGQPDSERALQPRLIEHHLQQRLHLLADVNAPGAELVPRLPPGSGGAPGREVDIAHCSLCSIPPAAALRLNSLGVAATMVVSIVHEDRLWGLVTAQHSQPRNLSQALRVAVELLAEAMSTRIAALESNTRAEQATQVRRFEQQLLEATASVGDWRHALAHDASVLLQPLKASGAVLAHEGEVLRCGEVPAGPDLQELLRWLASQPGPGPWHWACLGGHAPTLAGLTPRVAGVLAMRLSARRSDQLIWLRRQPSHLPPGHAQPWSRGDVALASALGRVLVDINAQANAVRLLIAQSQLARVRACLAEAPQAVVVADAAAGTFFANNAFLALAGRRRHECPDAAAFAMLFTDPSLAHQMLGHVRAEQRSWHGELALRRPDGCVLPVGVRAEPVPATDGALLGCMFIFEDLRPALNAETARQQLETSLARTGQLPQTQEGRQLVDALVSNTSLAATDIADSSVLALAAHSGPMLQALQAGAERTTALLARLRLFGN